MDELQQQKARSGIVDASALGQIVVHRAVTHPGMERSNCGKEIGVD
jgi:hypothetical protein